MAALLTVSLCGVGLPLDDYVNRPEKVFNWQDTGVTVKPLDGLLGATAYILNVTSLEWLDTTKVSGPNGAIWSHQVAVVVPHTVKTNVSLIYLTGGCNEHPSPPGATDEELLVVARVAQQTGAIGVVVYQIPNCPLVFASDPSQRGRGEDALIAWSWIDFVHDPTYDPERLVRLPMVKAAFACMRAAEQFTAQRQLGSPDGWIVAGASKRGWTTWMVGAAAAGCTNCSRVVALAPLVPIVPDIRAEVHRQWQSYNGFTFAFKDYAEAGIIPLIDEDGFTKLAEIVDPKYYTDRLALLPKVVVDSSDDEFMQFDWTDIWRDSFMTNTRLLIAPNSEHSLATGLPQLIPCLTATVESFALKTELPSFTTTYDNTTGAIRVTLPAGSQHGKVVLRHAQTISSVRRDFRWVRLANNETEPCKLPEIPLSKPVFGGNCIQPIIWLGKTLSPSAGGSGEETSYIVTPPEPKAGHWTGYYVEVYFTSPAAGDYMFTSPGYAWPNTLPFADCHGATCLPRLL